MQISVQICVPLYLKGFRAVVHAMNYGTDFSSCEYKIHVAGKKTEVTYRLTWFSRGRPHSVERTQRSPIGWE